VSTIAHQSTYDVVVIGAGFAGALTAMIAQKKSCRVLLIEKGRHPRIVIGESTTPLTNLFLEEIANEHDLPFLLSFTQYGKWKEAHPNLKVGLKRGFSFYNHQSKSISPYPDPWSKELFVAASPNDRVADTQWWRADWDSYLVDQCKKMGVEYWDQTDAADLIEEEDGILLNIKNSQTEKQIKARLLIDACGGSGGLGQLLHLSKKPLKQTPECFSVYGHFDGVEPVHTICHQTKTDNLPYPPDQSAIHHIVEGGWIWSLRFDHGTVSAGATLTEESYSPMRDQTPESIWSYLMSKHRDLEPIFRKATPLYPMRKIHRTGFQMNRSFGNRWILLASSAGFVDPLLSTGFPLTLQSIQRLAPALSPQSLEAAGPIQGLDALAKATKKELAIVDRMIGTLFATMNDFRHFAAATLVYFAAVSYTETARRLEKKLLAPGFLFSEDSVLSSHLLSTFETIQRIHQSDQTKEAKWKDLQSCIDESIEPFNVAGFSTKTLLPHFTADTHPLFEHAHKLEATDKEIQNMLIRSGLV
jgi:FADH2 O2-dependent halogenase